MGLPVRHPEFAARVVTAMKLAHITVTAIHKELEVEYEMARRYSLGQAMPRGPKLKKLASMLNSSAAWLAYGEGNPPLSAKNSGELTAQQLEWLRLLDQLSSVQQKHIKAILSDLASMSTKSE